MSDVDPSETPTQRGDLPPSPTDETIRVPSQEAASGPPDGEGRPFGRYRLLSALGHGGMGVVWKAWDTQLRRVVALKTIRGEVGEEQARRFLREAQLAAKLRHPGIVAVHDVGVHDGEHYFTADFVAGRPFDEVLREGVSVRLAVGWIAEVAEALSYAHQQGVVHRDVKPSNVLIDEGGKACVTDFGLAKEVDVAAGPALTTSGALLGTPQYMSPEQASSQAEAVGPATDQFSLGVMLYEAIVGRTPFQAKGLPQLLIAITDQDPTPPSRANPRVQRDLETICMKALEKAPGRRYASMADLAADLRSWLEGEPIRARPASMAGRLARKVRKHRWVVALVVVNLVIGSWAGIRAIAARGVVQERDLARETLRKAELVQRVLARWAAIGRTVREIEARCSDSTLSPARRREVGEGLWPDVEAFIQGTSQDATSQAAMKPLAGWVRCMIGDQELGLAWIREARRLDPDLPYGALVEALACLIRYKDAQPAPAVRFRSLGPEVSPPAREDERMRRLMAEVQGLLEEASGASVWGEAIAEDLKKAVDGIRAIRGGRYEDAERLLTEVLGSPAMETFDSDLRFERGMVRCFLGRYGEAARDLEDAAAARPRMAAVWLAVGFNRYAEASLRRTRGEPAQEPFEAAVRACDTALGLSPTLIEAFKVRGMSKSALGKHDAAIQDFDAGLLIVPDDTDLLVDRGAARYRAGDFAGAVRDAEEALRINPESVEALQNRGLALTELGRHQEAIASLDESLRLRPVDAPALLDRARARLLSGDAEGCATDADAALRLAPRSANALSLRGHARLESQDLDAALADFEAALAIDARSISALSGRGILRGKRGDLEGAIADHTAAIELSPTDAGLRYTRANLYRLHRDYDLAIAEYVEVLRLRPGDVHSVWYRSVAYEEKGDLARAVSDIEQALASAPQDWPWREAGRARLQAGHYNLACESSLRSARAEAAEAGALRDRAFGHLRAAIAAGWTDWAHMEGDADLSPLHADPRWKDLHR